MIGTIAGIVGATVAIVSLVLGQYWAHRSATRADIADLRENEADLRERVKELEEKIVKCNEANASLRDEIDRLMKKLLLNGG